MLFYGEQLLYGACSDGDKSTSEEERFSAITEFVMFELGDVQWVKRAFANYALIL